MLLIAVSVFFSHFAQSSNDDKAVTLLMDNLKAFNQFQATFKQQSLDDKNQPMQTMTGHLILKKPNLFYWQADEPAAQKLVCDGTTIWHFDEDLEQVIVQAYADQKNQSPLLLILEDEAAVKKRFDISLISNAPVQLFGLTPKINSAGKTETTSVESIELGFVNNQLYSLSFIDVLKQKTAVTFSQIIIDQFVDVSHFDFKIPVDADVLYE